MAISKRSGVRILAFALVGAIGFATYIYQSNRRLLDQRYPIMGESVRAASGTDAVRRGKRLADLTGCTDCHGSDLRGRLFEDEGRLHGRYYASNLTLKA